MRWLQGARDTFSPFFFLYHVLKAVVVFVPESGFDEFGKLGVWCGGEGDSLLLDEDALVEELQGAAEGRHRCRGRVLRRQKEARRQAGDVAVVVCHVGLVEKHLRQKMALMGQVVEMHPIYFYAVRIGNYRIVGPGRSLGSLIFLCLSSPSPLPLISLSSPSHLSLISHPPLILNFSNFSRRGWSDSSGWK